METVWIPTTRRPHRALRLPAELRRRLRLKPPLAKAKINVANRITRPPPSLQQVVQLRLHLIVERAVAARARTMGRARTPKATSRVNRREDQPRREPMPRLRHPQRLTRSSSLTKAIRAR